jgi:hypothetical protein
MTKTGIISGGWHLALYQKGENGGGIATLFVQKTISIEPAFYSLSFAPYYLLALYQLLGIL